MLQKQALGKSFSVNIKILPRKTYFSFNLCCSPDPLKVLLRASVLTLLSEVYGDKTTWVYSLTQVLQLDQLDKEQTFSIFSLDIFFHTLHDSQTKNLYCTNILFASLYFFPGLVWVCGNPRSFCWGNHVRCWRLLVAI